MIYFEIRAKFFEEIWFLFKKTATACVAMTCQERHDVPTIVLFHNCLFPGDEQPEQGILAPKSERPSAGLYSNISQL